MRNWLVLLSIVGLLSSGLEGATEELDADACDSGPGFELHHDQQGGDVPDGDGPTGDSSAAHLHFCHCAAHGVPLAAWWSLTERVGRSARPSGPRASYSSFANPPPVRPPIA